MSFFISLVLLLFTILSFVRHRFTTITDDKKPVISDQHHQTPLAIDESTQTFKTIINAIIKTSDTTELCYSARRCGHTSTYRRLLLATLQRNAIVQDAVGTHLHTDDYY